MKFNKALKESKNSPAYRAGTRAAEKAFSDIDIEKYEPEDSVIFSDDVMEIVHHFLDQLDFKDSEADDFLDGAEWAIQTEIENSMGTKK